MYKSCPKNVIAYLIGAAAFAVSLLTSFNVIIIVICGGALGFASFMLAKRTAGNGGKKSAPGKTSDGSAEPSGDDADASPENDAGSSAADEREEGEK